VGASIASPISRDTTVLTEACALRASEERLAHARGHTAGLWTGSLQARVYRSPRWPRDVGLSVMSTTRRGRLARIHPDDRTADRAIRLHLDGHVPPSRPSTASARGRRLCS
jgi:hypothetical protein